jgi:hypothetical protein
VIRPEFENKSPGKAIKTFFFRISDVHEYELMSTGSAKPNHIKATFVARPKRGTAHVIPAARSCGPASRAGQSHVFDDFTLSGFGFREISCPLSVRDRRTPVFSLPWKLSTCCVVNIVVFCKNDLK